MLKEAHSFGPIAPAACTMSLVMVNWSETDLPQAAGDWCRWCWALGGPQARGAGALAGWEPSQAWRLSKPGEDNLGYSVILCCALCRVGAARGGCVGPTLQARWRAFDVAHWGYFFNLVIVYHLNRAGKHLLYRAR